MRVVVARVTANCSLGCVRYTCPAVQLKCQTSSIIFKNVFQEPQDCFDVQTSTKHNSLQLGQLSIIVIYTVLLLPGWILPETCNYVEQATWEDKKYKEILINFLFLRFPPNFL